MIETHVDKYAIRVLVSKEDGGFVAHALELDLWGYGKNEAEALRDVVEMINFLISFARQKEDESMIPFQAPKEYFERCDTAHYAALRRGVFGIDRSLKLTYNAVTITLDLKKASKKHGNFIRDT